MFTGIIKNVSKVQSVRRDRGSLFVLIIRPPKMKLKKGDSVAVNGVCSTVRKISLKAFEVEYMPETVTKTTVGRFKKGTVVNLERPVQPNEFLDGHIVQGHVDTTGEVVNVKKVKQSKVLKIQVPKKFMALIVIKGSIAVDGVSLTIVSTGRDWFSVSLVSYTIQNTHLGILQKGSVVNIETDIIAKYVSKVSH
jgi:riboflavin synthase